MGREISCLGGFQECIASLAFGGFNGSSEDLSLEVGVIKIKSSTVLETSCVPNHVGPTVKTAEAYLTVLVSSVTCTKEGMGLIEDGEPSLE